MKTYLILTGLIVSCSAIKAQERFLGSGGSNSGSGGSISYSVGLIDYDKGGVQQPFEIIGIAKLEKVNSKLSCTVSPNPTAEAILLNLYDYTLENLSYSIYDNTGKLIRTSSITAAQTQISLQSQAAGIYYIHVKHLDEELGQYKIVKNN